MKIVRRLIPIILVLAMFSGGCTSNQAATNYADAENSQKFDKEVDVLVVGAGIAGLSAAIELADQGCEKILVVEKMPVVGGSAFISEGILAAHDSKLAKEQGIAVTLEDCYNYNIQNKKYTIDPELTMITTKKAGETIDWLMDVIKVPFEPKVKSKLGYSDFPIIHLVERGGLGFREPFAKAIEARPNIQILTESPATELITDDNRNVIGAVVKTKDDGEIHVGAKATILATGGYAGNKDLFTRLYRKNAVIPAGPLAWSTGDGLIMASDLGAGILNGDAIQCYFKNVLGEFEVNTGDTSLNTNNMINIFVGEKTGARFMDEKRVMQTFNKENYEDITNQMYKDGVDYYWGITDYAVLETFKVAEEAKKSEDVYVADTLEQLAEMTGINAEGLVKTVSGWNEMVKNGVDTQFGRTDMMVPIKAPYYAVKSTLSPLLAHGGLMINEKGEAIKITGKSIPGLYAAGEIAAASNSNGYTISNAITWGRIAAQNAAKYAKEGPDQTVTEEKKENDTNTESKKLEVTDGIYKGSAKGKGGDVVVEVVVENSAIKDIKILEQKETAGLADPALKNIPAAIIETQSLDIDTVSGATITSKAIISAVEAALNNKK